MQVPYPPEYDEPCTEKVYFELFYNVTAICLGAFGSSARFEYSAE